MKNRWRKSGLKLNKELAEKTVFAETFNINELHTLVRIINGGTKGYKNNFTVITYTKVTINNKDHYRIIIYNTHYHFFIVDYQYKNEKELFTVMNYLYNNITVNKGIGYEGMEAHEILDNITLHHDRQKKIFIEHYDENGICYKLSKVA